MAPHASFTHSVPCALSSTVLVLRMAHRILKETKQEPGTAEPDNMLGCCLVSFHFLWAILSTSSVLFMSNRLCLTYSNNLKHNF